MFSNLMNHERTNCFQISSKYSQFYEYFLHCNLGESKWNELFRLCGGNSRKNEFPMPSGLVESKITLKRSGGKSQKMICFAGGASGKFS